MVSIFLAENTQEDGSVLDEADFCAATAMLFTGAVDTSVTAIMSFVLGMLKNPRHRGWHKQRLIVLLAANDFRHLKI